MEIGVKSVLGILASISGISSYLSGLLGENTVMFVFLMLCIGFIVVLVGMLAYQVKQTEAAREDAKYYDYKARAIKGWQTRRDRDTDDY